MGVVVVVVWQRGDLKRPREEEEEEELGITAVVITMVAQGDRRMAVEEGEVQDLLVDSWDQRTGTRDGICTRWTTVRRGTCVNEICCLAIYWPQRRRRRLREDQRQWQPIRDMEQVEQDQRSESRIINRIR